MTRALWECRSCSFTSPDWVGSGQFSLCTSCERQAKAKAREELRQAGEPEAPTQRAPVGYVFIESGIPIRATERAVLFSFRSGRRWIPRSVIHPDSIDALAVKSWFARQLRHSAAGGREEAA